MEMRSFCSTEEGHNCVHSAWEAAAIIFTQIELGKRGYNVGVANGIAGDKTRAAVREYQINNGLPVELTRKVRDKQSIGKYTLCFS